MQLLLASSSVTRKKLLEKLQLKFDICSPDIDETQHEGESVQDLVQRLARQKAQACASQNPEGLIIAADQVAMVQNQVLGKPYEYETAVAQLKLCSGKTVEYHGGLCLLNAKTQNIQVYHEVFSIKFKPLSDETISRYIEKQKPFHCAGSYQLESIGIALAEQLIGNDYNTVLGLSLIKLTEMLANENFDVI